MQLLHIPALWSKLCAFDGVAPGAAAMFSPEMLKAAQGMMANMSPEAWGIEDR